MKRFRQYELLDLLAHYTLRFVRILRKGEKFAGEYAECKRFLVRIQKLLLLKGKYKFGKINMEKSEPFFDRGELSVSAE